MIKNIESMWENKKIIIESHDSHSDLIYYKLDAKNFDITISITNDGTKKSKRITKNNKEIINFVIDKAKIKQSLRANWTHYTDALYIRDINKIMKFNYITIHDCFVIDFLNVSNFIICANDQYNIKIFEDKKWNSGNTIKTFSLYIFI
jgi:hypothetical protein